VPENQSRVPVSHVLNRLREILAKQRGNEVVIATKDLLDPYPYHRFNVFRVSVIMDVLSEFNGGFIDGWVLVRTFRKYQKGYPRRVYQFRRVSR